MRYDSRKVVLVGTGMVGMSYAYALLNQNACDELVLIDLDRQRAEGEAMDLNHGLAFSGSNMKIYAGDYRDCGDADVVDPLRWSSSKARGIPFGFIAAQYQRISFYYRSHYRIRF